MNSTSSKEISNPDNGFLSCLIGFLAPFSGSRWGCFLVVCGLAAFAGELHAQDFYKPGAIVEIRLFFKEKNWDDLLDSLKQIGQDDRLPADALINGVRYKGVGVRYKGNSSYFSVRKSGSTKLPFNIKMDFTEKGQELPGGTTTIKLANSFRDPGFLREMTDKVLGDVVAGCGAIAQTDAPQPALPGDAAHPIQHNPLHVATEDAAIEQERIND